MKLTERPICVVDDDPSECEAVEGLLRSEGFGVETFASAQTFLARKPARPPACLILDIDIPKLDGLALQRQLARTGQRIPIIFLTANRNIRTAVQAIKAGAIDFLTKPLDPEELLSAIRKSVEPIESLFDASVEASAGFESDMIGTSAGLRSLLERVSIVGPTESTVLILGETGVGKELIARHLHRCSRRKDRPLVRVNCASIPKDLFESEFFGHVKGAFTGAVKDRAGRFEAAEGGTLFLDEVGEIPMALQSKLLRALHEKQYERVGEDTTRHVDVRIIAATNRDLHQQVLAGHFREDLYYRLNVFPLNVPSLRERTEDIPSLARHFVDLATKDLGCSKPRLTAAALEKLQTYCWPGNIRELRNVVERAVIMACGGVLDFTVPGSLSSPLAPTIHNDGIAGMECITEREWNRRERQNLLAALSKANWKIGGPGGAAELLGIKPTTLASRLKKMGLKRTHFSDQGQES